MKKLVYTLSILLITCSAFAQDLTDALRYSNYKISGTARSAAMGNAFGALGGDFSSLSINPAGIAVYRSGEFTFTPSFGKTTVDGTYLGNKATDSKYNLGVDNVGYVTTMPTGSNSESGMVSFSFGLGFNKLGSFSMNALAEGANSNNSILSYFSENMNNDYDNIIGNEDAMLDPYYEKLAWDTYLINHDDNAKEYFNDIKDNGYGQSQRKSTDRRGSINEYLISFGANFNHKFYLGGTVGIHDVYFKENANLYEWDAKNNIPYFNDLNFNTYLRTTGSGFNVKIGAIYKPTENLRLGFAVHTPTFYKFHDEYNSSMSASTFENGNPISPDKAGIYDYEIETPMKAILSGAYVIGKSGLISIDYEIVDYSNAKLKNGSDGYDYIEQNQTIQNAYKTVGNLHIGGEYRVSKSLSLRAGYENYPSVYQSSYLNTSNINSNTSYSTVSGGFGFRQGNVFFDAAVKHSISDENLKLYPGSPEMAKYSTTQNNVIFTLGYKF
jgi:long-subunit fatty acid transport protein